MRQRLLVGNWKMFTTAATARRLAADVVSGLDSETRVRIVICPPFPYVHGRLAVTPPAEVILGRRGCPSRTSGARKQS